MAIPCSCSIYTLRKVRWAGKRGSFHVFGTSFYCLSTIWKWWHQIEEISFYINKEIMAGSSNSCLTLEGIDDVEDFPQEDEGERSISRERYAHLCELVQMGNNAFCDKRFDEVAISTDDVYKSAEDVNHVTQELGGKITSQPGPIPGINTKIVSFVDPDGW